MLNSIEVMNNLQDCKLGSRKMAHSNRMSNHMLVHNNHMNNIPLDRIIQARFNDNYFVYRFSS